MMDATDRAAFIVGACRALQESAKGWVDRVQDVTGAQLVPDLNMQRIPLDIFEALWPRLRHFELSQIGSVEYAKGWLGDPGTDDRAIAFSSDNWPVGPLCAHPDWRVRSGLRTEAEVEIQDAARRDLQEEND